MSENPYIQKAQDISASRESEQREKEERRLAEVRRKEQQRWRVRELYEQKLKKTAHQMAEALKQVGVPIESAIMNIPAGWRLGDYFVLTPDGELYGPPNHNDRRSTKKLNINDAFHTYDSAIRVRDPIAALGQPEPYLVIGTHGKETDLFAELNRGFEECVKKARQ
ncbi:hypothetical protein [Kocuria marina]|uniref:hypothetical protein n=1 Tax=Kocuria marina TaxID=223184 RepID=UPI0019D0C3C4|nr:hypothetical protein [Kocuria indica]MBN6812808.1 hypothetical protein [Kocuria indica]MBN6844501.1 hypothetical protein [Kocuria indica]